MEFYHRTQSSNDGHETEQVSQAVEHLFRNEAGKMIAILTRIFGTEHLGLAEDVVQEALIRALRTWPFYGIPKNPGAWIMRTSRNLALDTVRREKVFRDKQPEIVLRIAKTASALDTSVDRDQEIEDDRLRLMFVCCHPVSPLETQVALALKLLCGFSTLEISRAFLTTEAAIAKRITRAKQKIRSARIPFEIPLGEELSGRISGVWRALYLLFNEGYKASSGEHLVREEICQEATRLARLLLRHPAGDQPKTHALLALMLLNAARFRGRVDAAGNLLRLEEQDRASWDQSLIAQGMFHLAQSATGEEISAYHLEAGIAACHCLAQDYVSTDWRRIRALYEELSCLDPSPVVALNRAVAIAQVEGPEAGLKAIEEMPDREALSCYYLFYAVQAELESQRSNFEAASTHLQRALQLTEVRSEVLFLRRKLKELNNYHGSSALAPEKNGR